MKSWLAKTPAASGPTSEQGATPSVAQAAPQAWIKPKVLLSLAHEHRADLWLALGAAAYLTWVLLWQYTLFAEGRFGYHDLTLITDFFTNALYHGKPFWITDHAIYHFKVHFTPTLLLLTPAFLLFKSQFALIAIVATTVGLGLFVAAREQHISLKEAGVPVVYRVLLSASFFLLLAFNRYTLRCMDSAHFEPVFIFPAMLVLAAVRRGESHTRTLLACLLALGVRQDTGLFLFFLLAACMFAPASWSTMQRPQIAAAAVLCGAYVLFATKLALPWFGSDTATRMWHRWGETWPDVFLSWSEQPKLVFEAVGNSEFLAWNAEFYFLHVVHGVVWLLTQLPGILFYTADAWDKQRLAYYNASFMLPGVALSLGFAQLHAAAFIKRTTVERAVTRHLCLSLLSGIFLYASVHTAFLGQRENEDTLQVGALQRSDVFVRPELRRLLKCNNIKSVAADFKSIVYVPIRLDRYLPHNALKADAVLVHRSKKDKGQPFFIAPDVLRAQLLNEGKYQLAFSVDDYDVFVANETQCLKGGHS